MIMIATFFALNIMYIEVENIFVFSNMISLVNCLYLNLKCMTSQILILMSIVVFRLNWLTQTIIN